MLTDLDKFQNICLWQGGNLLQSDGREGIYTSQMAGREFTPVRWQGGNLHQSDPYKCPGFPPPSSLVVMMELKNY
jgi:hypothetical protein